MVFTDAAIIVFFFVYLARGLSAEENSTRCEQICGAIRVQYPFGFSQNCHIQLICTGKRIKIGEFYVQNVTNTNILIDVPAQCHRNIDSLKPLFDGNYAVTWQNSLLLQNCSDNNRLSGCVIPTQMVKDRVKNLQGCDSISKDDNISCYSPEKKYQPELLRYADVENTMCGFLFSSIAVEKMSLELNRIELGWWVNGRCNESGCSPNAKCTNVALADEGTGFRCQCDEGFEGDGFVHGKICRKITQCGSSSYITCSNTKIVVLIGGIIFGGTVMAVLAIICYVIRRRSTSLKNITTARRLLSEAAGSTSIPFYPYKDIKRATSGFSDKQRLGTGAYGTVYAGNLHNNEWVAIKKIKHSHTESIDQVMNEIRLLSSVSHPNLVRLLGCCIEKGEQILVYEFMANGTLSQHLQKERGRGLPWTIRLMIASETAQAIAHLHSAISPPIYHRDIKSSNILLDHNYNSKVADFGLSRLGMTESSSSFQSHISTAPQGTPGYLDPQYHQDFHLSDKSDVYSFGVVLVEIITALKVVDFSRPHSDVNLAALAVDRIGRGCADEIVDPFLEPNRDAWTLSSIHKVAELAFRCLSYHKDMRPSMMEVADELEQIRLSGWAPMDENIGMMGSSVASSTCSSPFDGSDKYLGGMTLKNMLDGSRRFVIPNKIAELALTGEVKDSSPVSIHDPWLSEQSSPSTNSLLGNVVH